MELWTEYEGRTIDGHFPLKKLVLPQGRSAFFSTANGKGEPILIRLVACHFDEDEILARWRGVEALNHPNFLKLERYGQLELDQTKVVYAAFERTDGNLAQVVSQGCLSAADVRQLTESLASALQMLHANGFVHEHVEPECVFAIGEVVKLRTDCIRETPEGEDGRHAKQRDVHDLATAILQSLTQERTLEAAAARRRALPAPFDLIVPNALNGAWGLPEIAAALRPAKSTARTAGAAPSVMPAAVPQAPAQKQVATSRQISAKPDSHEDSTIPAALRNQNVPEAWGDEEAGRKKWMGAAALAGLVLLLLWAGWTAYHPRSLGAESRSAATAAPTQAAGRAPAAAPARATRTAAARGATMREQWRVVAYTYNHQDQAQERAAQLAQRHPALRPAVFSPSGRAPYLVTVGGAMGRNQADALAHQARSLGLPRDTYAQNYKVRP